MAHYVYILASRPGGAIYIGATSDLRRRLEQHRAKVVGHTARYGITTLVWFETHADLYAALERERQVKRWRRAWKDELIAEVNPEWRDLSGQIPL